jgi:REP element-mobilizing transposase RayT
MPRKPRIHIPGGLYHVILRGNDRQPIFFDVDDRQRWESLIELGLEKHQHRIHAYCWMTNHVHMAIQCHEEPLAKFVGFIAGQYARSTNKKMDRTGHIFERRHRAIPVQADSYLKELVRYIHLNPVQAGMVDSLRNYPWCSHHAYLNGNAPNWLTLRWVQSMFGGSVARARRRYAQFMQTEPETSIWQKFRDGMDDDHSVVGDDGFIASLRRGATPPVPQQALGELVQTLCNKYGVSASALSSISRDRKNAAIRAEIGLTAIQNGIATNGQVARYFNRDQSGLSRAISKLRQERE